MNNPELSAAMERVRECWRAWLEAVEELKRVRAEIAEKAS